MGQSHQHFQMLQDVLMPLYFLQYFQSFLFLRQVKVTFKEFAYTEQAQHSTSTLLIPVLLKLDLLYYQSHIHTRIGNSTLTLVLHCSL